MRSKGVAVILTALLTIAGWLTLVEIPGTGGPLHAGPGRMHTLTCPADGDVNQDGDLTPGDALLAFRRFLGLAALDTCQQDRADVVRPEERRITPADALCIFQRFLGLASCLDNVPPVADAGPDQTVAVGAMVILDGSGASDTDGDRLTFFWRLVAVPTGSTATLSDPFAVQPILVVDQPGDYVIELIVNDGTTDSRPAFVTLSTENSVPVADAGPDQTVVGGQRCAWMVGGRGIAMERA